MPKDGKKDCTQNHCSFHEAPAKPGGEGWLFSMQQQKLCHFKPSMATVHAQ